MIRQMRLLLATLFIVVSSVAYGEDASIEKPRELFPVDVDGKYGYIDKTAQMVIVPKFDDASDFSEGLARVRVGNDETGSFGYIDTTGKVVIKPKFKGAGLFSEGVAIADDGKGKGVIDKSGKYLFRFKFQTGETECFSEGLAAVSLGWKNYYGNYYGFIDKNNKVVIPGKYHKARKFSEGLAAVEEYGKGKAKWGEKTGYINKDGKWVISPQFKSAGDFHEGVARVYPERKQCGFIDKKGNWVVPAFFERCGNFSEGLAAVMIEGKFGYINKKGEVIITPKYTRAGSFTAGWAEVDTPGDDEFTLKRGYINKSGNYVWGPKKYSSVP